MKFEYCAAIRTLGTAGDKYYQTLLSLKQQTIPPKKILVYIAEGYPLPKETIGIEQYVYVKKGMIAQRALPYKEVDTEYILLLDDDLYLAPDAVERMYNGMTNNSGDVMCANVFPNHEASFSEKLRWIFFVGTFPMKSNNGHSKFVKTEIIPIIMTQRMASMSHNQPLVHAVCGNWMCLNLSILRMKPILINSDIL